MTGKIGPLSPCLSVWLLRRVTDCECNSASKQRKARRHTQTARLLESRLITSRKETQRRQSPSKRKRGEQRSKPDDRGRRSPHRTTPQYSQPSPRKLLINPKMVLGFHSPDSGSRRYAHTLATAMKFYAEWQVLVAFVSNPLLL